MEGGKFIFFENCNRGKSKHYLKIWKWFSPIATPMYDIIKSTEAYKSKALAVFISYFYGNVRFGQLLVRMR